MTLVWFIVWLIANNVGGHEPLLLDPVNAWTATLIVAVALDLSAGHAVRGRIPLMQRDVSHGSLGVIGVLSNRLLLWVMLRFALTVWDSDEVRRW